MPRMCGLAGTMPGTSERRGTRMGSGLAETLLGMLGCEGPTPGTQLAGRHGMFGLAGRRPGPTGTAAEPARRGLRAGGWRSEEQLVVAGPAVHLVATLAEGAFLQLAQAVGTDEVLGVVPAPGSCDAAAGDGVATAVADAALPLVEVQLAVRTTLQLEEGAAVKTAQALLGRRRGGWLGLGTRSPRVPASRPHSPRTRSTRGARRPAALTGNCPSPRAHSPGILGQTWPGSPGGSTASRRARGNLRGQR